MVIKNAKVFFAGTFQKLDVRTEHGVITEISDDIPSDEFLDCSGKLLIPGLIDLHTHGCMGYDFSTSTLQEIEKMCCFYAGHGVTSVMATTMTMEFSKYCRAMSVLKEAISNQGSGCSILGIRTEGPFLGKDKRGAHDPRYLMEIDEDKFNELDALSGNNIRIVDIDPKLKDALPFIKKYSKDKITSIAHTSCDYELGCKAVEAGASQITHLFNAMSSMHHRAPGLIGVVNDLPVRAELICDGFHIHPSVIRLMFKAVGERIMLISDSMSAAGLKDGEYELGGMKVYVQDRKATLHDGTIAGSTITVFDALKNIIKFGVDIPTAILSATLLPAKAIHAEDKIGSIEVGKAADLLVVSPQFDLDTVILKGSVFGSN